MNKHLKYSLIASCLVAQPIFSTYANTDSRIDSLAESIDRVKISGYLNITAGKAKKPQQISNDTGNYGDFSITNETWGGFQIDFNATEKLDFTLLTKYFAKSRTYDDTFGVDLAYLTYNLTDQTKIRAGILRVPLYKDSDYKDTGIALLWLRAPELVYTNSKVQRHTGLEILHDFYLGDGTLQVQAFYGQNEDPRARAKSKELTGQDKTFVIDDLMGIHATYSIDEHLFKIGSTTRTEPGELEDFLGVRIKNGEVLTNADGDEIPNLHAYGYWAGKRQTFHSLGYGYDDGQWKVDIETIFEITTDGRVDNGKYYASLGYRFDAITPYLMYQYRETLDDSKRGVGKNVYVHEYGNDAVREQVMFNSKSFEETMLSLGARYDISSSLALKVQADYYTFEQVKINGQVVERDNSLYSISLQTAF